MIIFSRTGSAGFDIVFYIVLLVSVFLIASSAADLTFQLGWGFKPKDLMMAVGFILFAMLLRLLGIKILGMLGLLK